MTDPEIVVAFGKNTISTAGLESDEQKNIDDVLIGVKYLHFDKYNNFRIKQRSARKSVENTLIGTKGLHFVMKNFIEERRRTFI